MSILNVILIDLERKCANAKNFFLNYKTDLDIRVFIIKLFVYLVIFHFIKEIAL